MSIADQRHVFTVFVPCASRFCKLILWTTSEIDSVFLFDNLEPILTDLSTFVIWWFSAVVASFVVRKKLLNAEPG